MKNNSGSRLLAALFVAGLVCAVSVLPAASQKADQSAPFGSSLKRAKSETKGRPVERANKQPVEDNLPQPEEIVRVNTSLVSLDVLVTDAKGRYVTGLTKDDFVLTEDDRPQTVSTVTDGDDALRLPRSIVLIFDRSQSQLPYIEASVEAAKTLVNQLTRTDEMAIVTDDVELAIGFTSDKKKLKRTLESLKNLTINGYRTRSMQFSALLATLRELIDVNKKRPIIILQTDGDEVDVIGPSSQQLAPSNYDLNVVYAEVERSRAKIYTVIPNVRLIGIPKEEVPGQVSLMMERGKDAQSRYKDMWYGAERVPPKRDNSTKLPENIQKNIAAFKEKIIERAIENFIKGQTAAARVADLTGGWTSYLEKPEQAKEIYARILSDINHRYVISYYPTKTELDGKLRQVRVKVRGRPDYVVQGRTSYYAMPR